MINENFVFSRPLSVTGAYFLPTRRIDGIDYPEKVFFHQMTLDRIENGEYVLQNTQFTDQSSTASGKKWWNFWGSKQFTTGMV